MMRARFRDYLRDDSGVTAIIVAVMAVALLGAAALAVDISRFTYQRQLTRNAVEAGAQAGAFYLPDYPAAAVTAARNATRYVDTAANPTISPLCAVPYVAAYLSYDSSTVQAYCKPGPVDAQGKYAQSLYASRCSAALGICTLPCLTASTNTCNTLSVSDTRTVNFLFGSVMGQFGATFGSSGQVAAACKGSSCGQVASNAMNVAIIADRTSSMTTANRTAMVTAIQSMLQVMTPSQHYVAFGGISKSQPGTTCLTTPSSSITATGSDWVPVDFSNDYLTGKTLNANSDLNKKGLASTCFTASSGGTYLASPLKFAARYLLGNDGGSTRLAALPARSTTAQKAIIFETDGQPNESTQAGTITLADTNEIGNATANTACQNFKDVATLAKAQKILIITVGFGSVNTVRCDGSTSTTGTSPWVRDVMAAVASPRSNGTPSIADSDCSTAAEITAENTDGDYYFCAAGGSDLSTIFTTAFTQLLTHSKFIRLP